MKYEYNVSDNILDVREMTDEEITEDENNRLILANKLDTEQAEAEAKAAAREALLDRLGITADEAALLLG
jgi:hypothetical protein